jgi:hypothetical protein
MAVLFLACTGVKPMEANSRIDPPEKSFLATGNEFCPSIALGLAEDWTYQYEEERLFAVAEREEELDAYLKRLETLVGYDWRIHGTYSPGPFRELFGYVGYFGTIGPMVSAKLANDFAWFDERARAVEDASFHAWFSLMREMFQFAGKDGAVWHVETRHHSRTLPRFAHQDGIAELLQQMSAWS